MANHQDLVVSTVFCNFALLQISDFPTNAPWAELIVNIQYACQRHYFGAMAEAYFDNKLKDASVNVQRRSKTYEAFERLPETFTSEDVMRCFGLTSDGAVRSKTRRLLGDHLIEKVSDGRQTTTGLSTFRKTGVQML